MKASGVKKRGGGMMEDDDRAFMAGALAVGGVNTGGGSAVIEDLIGERVTRDLARDKSIWAWPSPRAHSGEPRRFDDCAAR